MVRTILMATLLLAAATPVTAQITTYIAPPRASAESRDLIAASDSARRDSLQRAAVTNMTAWVDSAAGISVPATVGRDTVDPGRPIDSFRDGSVAPATASSLPALLAVGLLALGAGAVLLGRLRS
jgi:hypothetical protein